MPIEELAGIIGVVLGSAFAALKGYQTTKLVWRRLGVDSEDPDGLSLAQRVRETHHMMGEHGNRLERLEQRDKERTERSNDQRERLARLEYLTEKLRAARCESCPVSQESTPIALGK